MQTMDTCVCEIGKGHTANLVEKLSLHMLQLLACHWDLLQFVSVDIYPNSLSLVEMTTPHHTRIPSLANQRTKTKGQKSVNCTKLPSVALAKYCNVICYDQYE